MDPLLHRIEALPRAGTYAVTFVMPDGQQRSVVMHATGGTVEVPEASRLDGWPSGSSSYQAALASVAATHNARELAGTGRVLLQDVEGGWDVSLGNVILSATGPACVAHGDMELTRPALFTCATCGAAAIFAAQAV